MAQLRKGFAKEGNQLVAGKYPAETNSFKEDPGITFPVAADPGYQIRIKGVGGID